jgi:hypothetical protein
MPLNDCSFIAILFPFLLFLVSRLQTIQNESHSLKMLCLRFNLCLCQMKWKGTNVSI